VGSRIGTAILGLVALTSFVAMKFGRGGVSVKLVATACIGFSAAIAIVFYWVLAYKVDLELYLAVVVVVLCPLLFALIYAHSHKRANKEK
jgi:hypothetical protein